MTAAELWALYHGLELAWAEGLRKISVAVDSTAVMTLISKEPEQFNPNPYQSLQKLPQKSLGVQDRTYQRATSQNSSCRNGSDSSASTTKRTKKVRSFISTNSSHGSHSSSS